MKIASHPSIGKNKALEPSSIKTCMLLLEKARTDPRVLREARALKEAGFAASIVDVEEERSRPAEEDFQGIRLKHIFMPSWFISARFKPWFLVKLLWLIMLSTVRLLRGEVDLYHAHDVAALPACYLAALLRRKPLIFDAHDLTLDDPAYTRWRRLTAFSGRILTSMLRRCAGMITVSPPLLEEMRQRYHVSEVTLIRNIPPYRIVPTSNRLRQVLGLSSDVRIALYQGYLQPNRSLDILVRAAPFLAPDIVIVMMGKDMKATRASLEGLIASEGVVDRVKILPPVPYEELLDWTVSADIGLIVYSPDYSRNVQGMLPNKFFEYLMAGLPVLASQLTAIAEVIKTYDVGQIVSSLAPADVAAAINSMLADPVALTRMHRSALMAAQQEFYWEKESQKLVRLYHDILERR